MSKISLHVWDLPLRLFHWLLAGSVVAAYVTAKLGGALMDWHGRLGYFILGLLIFRILWGFLGSPNARFSNFFPTISRLLAYLIGKWHGVGHNPLGGLSVLALLTVLLLQVGTGLFANDDIAFEGPFVTYIDKSLSDRLTGWHSLIFNGVLSLIVLHLLAIIYHRLVKKNNLIVPMLTGKKQVPTALAEKIQLPARQRVGAVRLIVSLSIAGTLVWGISGGIAQFMPAQAAPPPSAPTYPGF